MVRIKQAAPIRDLGNQLVIEALAPGTTNFSINARDERHITLDESDSLRTDRPGLKRYQLNRNAAIGGHSYDLAELYLEHREWQKQAKKVNKRLNEYVWQTENLREGPKLMDETHALIKLVESLIRERDERGIKFEIALHARKLADEEDAELRQKTVILQILQWKRGQEQRSLLPIWCSGLKQSLNFGRG
ncbi:hypothetical protein BPAE_0156g00100 [Botrytis paeoniae]|uniref:Uncharacterized protein n=1 Tax=Botrytis paeoniae TaxID=278948 RepID=A0A4Z1FGQ5_9HELO|nr:hypothetical protein BPAE_0156g00100 [Botrytis paeoniae]